ncbi:MAG: NUDIX domain-containing protein [Ruminococcus sp.]|nr:NUDIX domain-containing protein [Ruminococcus sp.]
MDCTFKTTEGKFNYRVAAIIKNGSKILMANNPEYKTCCYSVGGRVRLNETLEEAIVREVFEETGIKAEIDRMGFIHENFFTNFEGELYHELSIFFYIKPNEEILKIKDGHLTNDGPNGEYLKWIDINEKQDINIYPEFYLTELKNPSEHIRHIVTKDN